MSSTLIWLYSVCRCLIKRTLDLIEKRKAQTHLFCKMINSLAPEYLSSRVPRTVGSISQYSLRNGPVEPSDNPCKIPTLLQLISPFNHAHLEQSPRRYL